MVDTIQEAVTDMPFERDVEQIGNMIAPVNEMALAVDETSRKML